MDSLILELIKLAGTLLLGGVSGSFITHRLASRRARIDRTHKVIADLEEKHGEFAEVRGLLLDGRILNAEQRNAVTLLGGKFDSIARQYHANEIDRKLFDSEVEKDFMCSFLADALGSNQFQGHLARWSELRRYCESN
jgi:hypothetical protein